MMHVVTINGRLTELPDELPDSLAALLKHLNVDAATVVAEVDGLIIRREAFDKTPIRPAQTIELVRFVGGG